MTQTMELSGAAGVVAEGDNQIRGLRAEIDKLDEQIMDVQDEIAAIDLAHSERGPAITAARSECERTQLLDEQAQSYAALAQRLPHQHTATKEASAARKNWQAAKAELARLTAEDAAAYELTDPLEADLYKKVASLQLQRETRIAEMRTVTAGRDKAQGEYGHELHAETVGVYDVLSHQVAELSAQLVEAQIALHDHFTEGLAKLATWPDLQRDLARRIEPEDATSRALATVLLYVQELQRDLPAIIDLPQDFKHRGRRTIWDVLGASAQELIELRRWPQQMTARIEETEIMVNEYKAWLLRQQQ